MYQTAQSTSYLETRALEKMGIMERNIATSPDSAGRFARRRRNDRVNLPVGCSLCQRKHCSLKHQSEDSSQTTELLTLSETATFLNTSVSSVRRLQYGRHIAFIKVGGGVRFAKSDLIAYLEKRRVESLDQ